MNVLYVFIEEEKHHYILNKYLEIFGGNSDKKFLKYRKWQDAQLSVLGRILLKYGLSKYYDINDFKINVSNNGKPFLQDHQIYFNISHSKNLVVCAISEFPVGIDVEFSNYGIDYLEFCDQMTKNELLRIQESENHVESFFNYWTEKESLIKANGMGLQIPLKSFEICNHQTCISNVKYFTKKLDIHKEYHCCIAAEKDLSTVFINVKKVNIGEL